ncbi:hypothetical protein R1flu_011132 [Riccia fluitans]|uniref:Uncharacterized protein n=1 Tax=Riccia fluitans TaxID=41844 RepID=A0ABD1Z6Y3_9MARC
MDDTPTYQEFSDALRLFLKEKSPGIDGLNADCLVCLWPIVGKFFATAMARCWESRSFPVTMLEGVIKLIPKVEVPVDLGDWRPIALLTALYTVVAKSMEGGRSCWWPGIGSPLLWDREVLAAPGLGMGGSILLGILTNLELIGLRKVLVLGCMMRWLK